MPTPTYVARSVTELVALRAREQGNDPAVHTGAAEFGDELKTLSYGDIQKAVDRLSAYYADLGLQQPSPPGETPPEQIISVLTSTAIDETLLEIALAKLGLAALLLSVNNSVAAVVHLCRLTKSSHLIYGSKFAAVAQEAKVILGKEGYKLEIVAEKRFPLWGAGGVRESKIAPFPARLSPVEEAKRTAVILHSSGSTGFPKPVYITHYGLIANIALSAALPGFSALPLFHGFGHFSVFRCYYHAQAFTLLPPNIPITAANIVKTINNSPTPPRQHFAVPYVLKLLGETEEGVHSLTSMDYVSFAGAAVPDDLGDRLVAAGVPLTSVYGTTETGGIMTSRRNAKVDKAWNWLRAEGLISEYLELAPQGSGTFEVIIKDGWPAKIMSNRDDGAYCTKDLVMQHPDHPTWFKYIGRLDDTLTQTLGEKTNPVPIELAIRGNSPLVQECIVFGDARPQVGALILPSDAGAELSKDKKKYLEAIWPVIEEANTAAPSHSRILPEMVEVLPYGTEIPVATKMSILRPACYKKFAHIIDTTYERFEKGTGQPKRDINDQAEMEAFLKETILAAIGEKAKSAGELTTTTDLFAFGVDSLQATKVRNALIKSIELGEVKLGQNIVYEHPSITQLAQYILALKSGSSAAHSAEQIQGTMLAMVEKWCSKLVEQPANSAEVKDVGNVVVLTGATGSLGAHILDQLTSRSDVSKVVCLSRAKSHEDSAKRVQDSLAQRLRSLSPEAQAKIVSFASDVNKSDLGLSPQEYESLRRESTAIIHNAWPVNFVLSIKSFDEHIGGAVNLLNLALASPRAVKPAFFFSSSVGTRQGRPDPVVVEDFPDSPVTAGGMGYGQSKWVVEKICERAAKETKARVGVLRIGQLVGDTENGVWNETEAWPLMFRTANVVGALPFLEEKPSWLPVDHAGSAIAEIAVTTASPSSPIKSAVYHVLNPHIGKWSDILEGLKAGGLKFEVIERTEWLERLAKSNPDVAINPSYKLLSFYQNRIGKKDERPPMDFLVEKTSKVSPTIANTSAVNADLVSLWAKQWKKSGFF